MKKGFTLIELLVVISIIALLSSVVLSSLNAARTRASDAGVKAAMKQMHIQVQNFLDSNANLTASINTTPVAGSPCTLGVFNDTKMLEIQRNIITNIPTTATLTCTTDSTATKWAFSVSALKSGGNWCTDNNTGWFKAYTTNSNGTCS